MIDERSCGFYHKLKGNGGGRSVGKGASRVVYSPDIAKLLLEFDFKHPWAFVAIALFFKVFIVGLFFAQTWIIN